MNRRRYLGYVGSFAGIGLAGCTGPAFGDGTRNDPSQPPSETPTAESPGTVIAGEYTARLSRPRVRASVLRANVHVDVDAEPGSQFLVFDVETEGAAVEDLPLSLLADGERVARHHRFVGRSDSERRATVSFAVPVAAYDSATVVLAAGGESDRWPLPAGIVATFGRAPTFVVESLTVPDSVEHGNSFEASFTVANRGDRDARFLAEFGHGLVSDTGEVELRVPAGKRVTHTQRIEPYYGGDPEAVPVVLDWGLDRRRVDVTVER